MQFLIVDMQTIDIGFRFVTYSTYLILESHSPWALIIPYNERRMQNLAKIAFCTFKVCIKRRKNNENWAIEEYKLRFKEKSTLRPFLPSLHSCARKLNSLNLFPHFPMPYAICLYWSKSFGFTSLRTLVLWNLCIFF